MFQTNMGKLLGAACSFVGTLGIAFPIPVVVAHFNYLYNMDRDDNKVNWHTQELLLTIIDIT